MLFSTDVLIVMCFLTEIRGIFVRIAENKSDKFQNIKPIKGALYTPFGVVRTVQYCIAPKPPSDAGGGKNLRFLTEGENMKAYNKENIPLAKVLRKKYDPLGTKTVV